MSEKSLESDVLKEVFTAMGKHFEWDTDVDVTDSRRRGSCAHF